MTAPRSWGFLLLVALGVALFAVLVRDHRRLLLAGMILALPLNISKTIVGHPIHFGGAQALEVFLLDLPLLALYVLWIWEALGRRAVRLSIPLVYSASLAAFLLLALLSFSQSKDLMLSLFELYRTVRGVLIFVYVAKHVDMVRDLKLVLTSLMFGLVLLSAEAVGNYLLGTAFNLAAAGRGQTSQLYEQIGQLEIVRTGGSLGPPNALASYIALLLPIPFALLFSRISAFIKALNLLVLALGLATLLLTMSRGSWFALAAAMLFMLILAAHRGLISPLMIPVTLSLAAVGLLALNQITDNVIWLRLTASQPENVSTRYQLVDIAIEMLRARPVLGVGLNNFTQVMPAYDVTGLSTSMPILMPVHNIYLLIAAEVGIFGFLALGVFVTALVVGSIRTTAVVDSLQAWVLLGLLGGFVTIIVHGIVDAGLRMNATFYTFWFFAGLVVSAGMRAKRPQG
jgi:putative inorganic carbon (hco3(-)) transporter